MSMRRILVWLLPAVLIGASAYWLLRPTPILVETAVVAEGRFVAEVTVDGRTRVRQRYVVSAPIAGRLERLKLKAGDIIERGAVVAALRPNPPPLIDQRARRELEERLGAADAQVEEAEALHARARVARDKAASDFERTRQLQLRGFVAATVFDRDKAAVEQADRDLVAAERRAHAAMHQRTEAQEALRRGTEATNQDVFELRSPIAGAVLRVVQESEAPLQPGASIVELGDTADLEIIADPLTADAVQIQPGAPAAIERWGGPHELAGRVRLVEPAGFTKISALGVEEQRTWVVIDLTAPPMSRPTLGDAYRVEARIIVQEIERATIIPVGALFRRGQAWHVFAVEEGRARSREIEVLRRSGALAAVGRGIPPGASIILFPPSSVRDGASVATRLARSSHSLNPAKPGDPSSNWRNSGQLAWIPR